MSKLTILQEIAMDISSCEIYLRHLVTDIDLIYNMGSRRVKKEKKVYINLLINLKQLYEEAVNGKVKVYNTMF